MIKTGDRKINEYVILFDSSITFKNVMESNSVDMWMDDRADAGVSVPNLFKDLLPAFPYVMSRINLDYSSIAMT